MLRVVRQKTQVIRAQQYTTRSGTQAACSNLKASLCSPSTCLLYVRIPVGASNSPRSPCPKPALKACLSKITITPARNVLSLPLHNLFRFNSYTFTLPRRHLGSAHSQGKWSTSSSHVLTLTSLNTFTKNPHKVRVMIPPYQLRVTPSYKTITNKSTNPLAQNAQASDSTSPKTKTSTT